MSCDFFMGYVNLNGGAQKRQKKFTRTKKIFFGQDRSTVDLCVLVIQFSLAILPAGGQRKRRNNLITQSCSVVESCSTGILCPSLLINFSLRKRAFK